MIRTAPGMQVHRAPFGGGFVVDPASFTVVEVDERTIELLLGPGAGPEVEPDTLPAEVGEVIAAGLRRGWLVADDGPEPGAGRS